MSKTVTSTDINGKTYEIPANNLQWRPAAYGIVIKDNKILLSKQFGKYDLPGGGLNLGEAPEAAVIREVKEETGIDVKTPKLITVKNSFFQSTYKENKTYQSILFYFLCEYIGGELSVDGLDEYEKEIAELAEWIPLSEVDRLETASTVDYRPFIKKALSDK